MPAGLSFLLSNTDLNARGFGVRTAFGSVAQAREALAARTVDFVGGALGFDTDGPASLIAPERVDFSSAAPPATVDGSVVAEVSVTPDSVHRERVVRALDAIASGAAEKVVVARSLDASLTRAVEPAELIGRFTATAGGSTVFAADLSAAPGHDGNWLIGASPELLLRKRGSILQCVPYAGSAPKLDTAGRPVPNAAEELSRSAKDLREHAYVVDYLRDLLQPLCSRIAIPDRPQTISTNHVWHLATPITGELADPTITALELAALLSPTPAVCGTPTEAAARIIEEVEGPREFYAGTVGWCDAAGDGEWVVSIRCLELDSSRTKVSAWAGGGIVAGSDPDAEVAETTAKFQTVLSALADADRPVRADA